MKRLVAFGGGNHFYRAVRELGRLLAHVSPVQWDNVTLYGAYDIRRELVVVHA